MCKQIELNKLMYIGWATDGLQELSRNNLPANVLVSIMNDLFMSTLKTIQTTFMYENISYIELYFNTHYCKGGSNMFLL